ncbi:hypothetical protein ACFYXJ_01890 [Streptomyces sp. NPDC002667]|uniref:hypothetical protein n=1 Tax=Streptomyces sp. NPDC002667 TaxID=3364657 RepID=UPI0036A5EF57
MPHERMEYDARPAPQRVGPPVYDVHHLASVASGAFYTASAFWAATGVGVAALTGGGAIWAALRTSHPRWRLTYSTDHDPLVDPLLGGRLEIRRDGILLTDPHLVRITLVNPGRRDIASSAFDQGRPLHVDLGVPYLEMVGTVSEPSSAQPPPASVDGSRLSIGPGRIGCGTTITYLLLVDTVPTYSCTHSLLDVRVSELPAPPFRRSPRQPPLVLP